MLPQKKIMQCPILQEFRMVSQFRHHARGSTPEWKSFRGKSYALCCKNEYFSRNGIKNKCAAPGGILVLAKPYIVDYWLSIFKISLCPIYACIKLTRYEYFLVLWVFKCFIFNLLHPLDFCNIIKVIFLVLYMSLNNF